MKNKVVKLNDDVVAIIIVYKEIELQCLIDKEDLDKVSSIRGTWHITVNRKGHLDGVRTKIQKNGIRKQIWMHNVIMPKKDENNIIDHINHNTLDNRRSNLREITKKENSQNTSVSKSKTGIRNITIDGDKYRVRINKKSFGRYDTLEEAIEVANLERGKMFPKASSEDNRIILDIENKTFTGGTFL